MKVYVLILDGAYGKDIKGVFKKLDDVVSQVESMGEYAEDYITEEHEIIE